VRRSTSRGVGCACPTNRIGRELRVPESTYNSNTSRRQIRTQGRRFNNSLEKFLARVWIDLGNSKVLQVCWRPCGLRLACRCSIQSGSSRTSRLMRRLLRTTGISTPRSWSESTPSLEPCADTEQWIIIETLLIIDVETSGSVELRQGHGVCQAGREDFAPNGLDVAPACVS
jgi:hypothetical protein